MPDFQEQSSANTVPPRRGRLRYSTANRLRRTKPRGRHPDKALSAAFIRSAPPGRHCDGQRLYFVVQPTGTRSWVQRLVVRGRKRELGLGSTALVSLAEARERTLSNRKLAREGGAPLAEKRRADAMPTFADAAARVVEQKRAGWRSPVHARTWPNSLELHAFPRIGSRPVSEVTSADVLGCPHADLARPLDHPRGHRRRARDPQCRRVAAAPSSFSRSQRKL